MNSTFLPHEPNSLPRHTWVVKMDGWKWIFCLMAGLGLLGGCQSGNEHENGSQQEWNIPLQSRISSVQPLTGMVFWTDSPHNRSGVTQLEFSYFLYNRVVKNKGNYDWTILDRLLDAVASRGHQLILRFRFVWPGQPTSVPDYIRNSPGYREIQGYSEGLVTWFPDWSHPALQEFTLEFYSRLAHQYDDDPRLAFLQVGFGLWAEYHIYDGPLLLGRTFPSKAFQIEFLRHMQREFSELHWSISIDAAEGTVSPFADHPELLDISFGLFDDSFLCQDHHGYNADCFEFFDSARYEHAPIGGELSYYSDYDQRHALDEEGPYGVSFEEMSRQFQVSYMIGNDQPDYQPLNRIRQAGMALGYRFRITSFVTTESQAKVGVRNDGIAPFYYDAYVTVNGVRCTESLKFLLPGEEKVFVIPSGGPSPVLTISCDRLVAGQAITYEADL